MNRSLLEMPVADGRTDGTESIGPLSALSGVQKHVNEKLLKLLVLATKTLTLTKNNTKAHGYNQTSRCHKHENVSQMLTLDAKKNTTHYGATLIKYYQMLLWYVSLVVTAEAASQKCSTEKTFRKLSETATESNFGKVRRPYKTRRRCYFTKNFSKTFSIVFLYKTPGRGFLLL